MAGALSHAAKAAPAHVQRRCGGGQVSSSSGTWLSGGPAPTVSTRV